MRKQALYKTFLVVLSALIVANSTIAYGLDSAVGTAVTVSWQDKIQPYLLEKMQAGEERLPIWLWMEDIDEAAAEQTVYARTGLREANLSVIDEPLSDQLAERVAGMSEADDETNRQVKAEFEAYIDRTQEARAVEAQRADTYLRELRSVQKDMLAEKNAAIFQSLGISEGNLIMTETQAPVYLVYVESSDIERLAKHPKVTALYYYDMDEVAEPCADTLASTISATSIGRIRSEVGLTGKGVKIGIFDVGKVQSHEDIAASRITYLAPYVNEYKLHSTEVARVAAGANGVAPAASIYSSSSDMLDEDKLGSSDIIQAITNQCNAGVHVINCSMQFRGQRDLDYSPSEVYLDYMVRSKRLTFVVAAGNYGIRVNSPGLAYNVITVGGFYNAGTKEPNDDVLYDVSGYNDTTGCFKPDLIADMPEMRDKDMAGNPIISVPGTSFAAPVVTGTVALLYQLRPALTTQPEAVKAILMASCHRKVKADPNDALPGEAMTDGLTKRQGAGAMDPYKAVAIAGSHHYNIHTMSSTATQEEIRFNQPAYGSTGLNVSLAWSAEPASATSAGSKIDLNLSLYRGSTFMKSSAKTTSSGEMAYVTPSASSSDYKIQVKRYSATGTPVRYAYAFSVNRSRYQYTGITEGVFYIKNKATGHYLTLSGGQVKQSAFTGGASQKWLLSVDTIYAVTATENRLSIGSVISGNYKRAVTDSSSGTSVIFQRNRPNNEDDGSVTFYTISNASALGVYNNSSASGTAAAWSPYVSSNAYQQWYLEPVAYQRGDVNYDGAITAADAQLVLNYSVSAATFSDLQKYLGDVNGDGEINASDALLINQIVAGTVE